MDVEVRGSHGDVLHEAVSEGYAALESELGDRPLPRFVRREFEGYLGCGDPARGFAWLRCGSCATHRLVPFSCKGRGFCPVCCGRRMVTTARRWTEALFPRAAVRQWVLTVPWTRRGLLARRPDLMLGVVGIAQRWIERWYRRASGRVEGEGASATVVQRVGSSLALNVHAHALMLDGVYVEDARGALVFRRSKPGTRDVMALVEAIARSAERWLSRQGFPADEVMEVGEDDGRLKERRRAGRLRGWIPDLLHAPSPQFRLSGGCLAPRRWATTSTMGRIKQLQIATDNSSLELSSAALAHVFLPCVPPIS